MDDYVRTGRDNGGVHINSGIPNHAFYLAATALGGNAWERAGQIWYDVLTGAACPRTRFAASPGSRWPPPSRFGEGEEREAAGLEVEGPAPEPPRIAAYLPDPLRGSRKSRPGPPPPPPAARPPPPAPRRGPAAARAAWLAVKERT